MKNHAPTLSLLLAAIFVFPFLAAPAHAGDIQFFPPVNMPDCNANTTLMFDGTHPTRCAVPPSSGSVAGGNSVSFSDGTHTYTVPASISCTTTSSAGTPITSIWEPTRAEFEHDMLDNPTPYDANQFTIWYHMPAASYTPFLQVVYLIPSGEATVLAFDGPASSGPYSTYGCPTSIPVTVK